MNKAEWDAMSDLDKNVRCSQLLGRVQVDPEDAYGWWRDPHTGSSERLRSYTTDRNACALVLDEIKKRDGIVLSDFYIELIDELVDARAIGVTNQMSEMDRDIEMMCVDPDLICYCAVKAVEDVPEG